MRLLFILLFPLFTFSQITLQEILAIDSENTFKRTMIENSFEFSEADESVVTYHKKFAYQQMISANFRRGDSLSTDESIYFIFTADSDEKNITYYYVCNI